MKKTIASGVWPTMITPFTDNNKIDYKSLEELIEWYIKAQVDGLFAVCLSSELFFLSLNERVELAKFVVDKVAGRVSVIASGNVSNILEDQLYEMKSMADTGIDASVLICNRFANENDSNDVFKRNVDIFLNRFNKDISLGFYECPYPYKRTISPELLMWVAESGRFEFLKDTTCDEALIGKKIQAVKGTNLKVYNANAATLLTTLKNGAAGYSGILANMFPELFVWLTRNWSKYPEKAYNLQLLLGSVAAIEKRIYPICAKRYMQIDGLNIKLNTRSQDMSGWLPSFDIELTQLHSLIQIYSKEYIL